MNHTIQPETLQTYFTENLPTYLELLRQMVNINSFTANAAGINQLGQLTAQAFEPLGFTAETVPSDDADFGNHLIMTKPGKSNRTIGLISHLDTVFPPDEEQRNNFAWREEGSRIYGPGTVDIKGGTVIIVMILQAIQTFCPEIYDEVTWVVLLNASEERDGRQFGRLCVEHLGQKATAALIFEGGSLKNDQAKIVVARKGMARYQIKVEGKAAHAGNGHAQGASAIVQMADTVQQVAALTDYEKRITFNVGSISGGTVSNRVPHHAEAQGEMRAFDMPIYQQGMDDLLKLAERPPLQSADGEYACQTSVEIIQKKPPWARNQATDNLFKIWQDVAPSLGLEVVPEERGGLSDGNHFWEELPTLDGLGPSGDNAHCSERSDDGSKNQEYVSRETFVPKAMLNTVAILKLIGD